MTIPRSHPRYESLVRRERLVRAWKDGVVVPEGLIAYGRGEAWDYLFGEGTSAPALVAERAAAAHLLAASHPVISVNGNVAALAAREVVQLARAIPARIEVNLFHRSESRVKKIVRILERAGGRDVLGLQPNARIPGIESKRALSHRDGIFRADVVLVPLEDGDRAEALVHMGKVVISVDLNPLSRTSQRATIPIVDELTRAILNTKKFVEELKENPEEAGRVLRVVEFPAIPKLPGRVEHKEVGGAHRAVRFGDLLALVAEVREVVPLPLRSLDHVGEVVLGIALLVVRVDRDELDALSGEVSLDRNRAVLPGLHIGAVVAPKCDHENRLVLERA